VTRASSRTRRHDSSPRRWLANPLPLGSPVPAHPGDHDQGGMATVKRQRLGSLPGALDQAVGPPDGLEVERIGPEMGDVDVAEVGEERAES
jgi:hypothetical protein